MRRLTVDISDDLGLKFDRLIDHGYKGKLMDTILAEVLDILEKVHPEKRALVMGAILSKDIMIIDMLRKKWELPT
jgi:hypothetical protein